MAQEIITESGATVFFEDFERVDDVAEGFRHLDSVVEHMTVGVEDFRKGEVESEKDGRPDDGMETENIFSDELDGSGPESFKVGSFFELVFGVAENG